MTGENNYLEFNTYTRHTSFSVCRQEMQQWYYSSDPAKLDVTIQLWEFCMHVCIRRGKWNYNSVGKGWADLVKKFGWGEERERETERKIVGERERGRHRDRENEVGCIRLRRMKDNKPFIVIELNSKSNQTRFDLIHRSRWQWQFQQRWRQGPA